MQQEMFIQQEDYSGEKVLLGLSGGINSAAVLAWISQYPEEFKPKELHLYYAHFEEHSSDTFRFVKDCIRYARKHFENVKVKITRNSVLRFFEEQKMIPHPMLAPCTKHLKIIPMHQYMKEQGIKVDLVGYVREEKKRMFNMAEKVDSDIVNRSVQADEIKKHFPISDKYNEWCFQIVEQTIGWYPEIYNLKWNDLDFMTFVVLNLGRFDADIQKRLKTKLGTRERVFTHNNCLPCKNMQQDDFLAVEFFYPEYHKPAMDLSERLQKMWGRALKENKGDQTIEDLFFHLTFGRTDEETGYQKQSCGVCAFD